MRRSLTTLVLAGVLATGGLAASAQQKAAEKPAPTGYLGGEGPDSYRILPPAPTAGTFRYEADRSTYLATRKLEGSPRWSMAASDAVQTVPALLKDMSCAAGVELSPETAPKLATLLGNIVPDLRHAVDKPKDLYKRQRPFLIDEGPVCVDKPDTPDYPSGHTTYGWAFGLILAELFPDHATELLARGRSYGESRLVCGVHNMSAVEAGRTNGAIVVAGLHGSAAFRADLEGARKEVARLRKTGKAPDPAACAAEAELVAQTLYN